MNNFKVLLEFMGGEMGFRNDTSDKITSFHPSTCICDECMSNENMEDEDEKAADMEEGILDRDPSRSPTNKMGMGLKGGLKPSQSPVRPAIKNKNAPTRIMSNLRTPWKS